MAAASFGACIGKVAHMSQQTALDEAMRLTIELRRSYSAYSCRCGWWHCGRTREED